MSTQQYPVDLYSYEWYITADEDTFNEGTETRYKWLHNLPDGSWKFSKDILGSFTIIFSSEKDASLYRLTFE